MRIPEQPAAPAHRPTQRSARFVEQQPETRMEGDMNNDFVGIDGAMELSETELMQIQGGNIFGDAWNWTKTAVSDVGHAIGKAATATYNAVTSKDGKKAVGLVGSIAGIVAGIVSLF
jgi:hypothetical protein